MKTWFQRIASKLNPVEPEEAEKEASEEFEREFRNTLERNRRIRELGEDKGPLIFALEAIVQSDEDGLPMEPQDTKALADMARRYLNGLDCYPGQIGELNLLMQKRDAFGKSYREAALYSLVDLRMQGYPLDNSTYELAASKHGLSRSTLVRYVKEHRSKMMIVSDGDGGLTGGTLSSLLKNKRKS